MGQNIVPIEILDNEKGMLMLALGMAAGLAETRGNVELSHQFLNLACVLSKKFADAAVS